MFYPLNIQYHVLTKTQANTFVKDSEWSKNSKKFTFITWDQRLRNVDGWLSDGVCIALLLPLLA